MAKDREDGPDDEEEPPLTQRELLDVAIRWFETSSPRRRSCRARARHGPGARPRGLR